MFPILVERHLYIEITPEKRTESYAPRGCYLSKREIGDELTEAQLAYAANDVRYLLPARERLEQMLRREGRWDLAQRCFQCVPVVAELDRLRFHQIFEH